MESKRIIIKLTCASISLVILLGIFIGNIGINIRGNSGDRAKDFYIQQEINDLIINVVSDDVRVYTTDEDEIQIKDLGRSSIPLEIRVVDDKLFIDRKQKWMLRLFGSIGKGMVEIYLPDRQLENVEFDMVSGDLKVEKLGADNMKVDVVSGDIKGELIVRSLEIDGVSCGIDLKVAAEELAIDTVSGDINLITIGPVIDIEIESTSGDVNIDWDNSYGLDVRLDSVSGNLEANIGEIWEGRKGVWVLEYNEGGNKVDIKTTSGDVYIK